ncbi:MAG TPA: right-handed parallel beta-helix repeat-containing protein [Candidatus Hydrogenedentes bacterium]|nr:right-handed parallel beta-helix repeat-containing protein [Candidatus Hydrogenedentota bacterium]HPG68779.1 right-handed parallel beta-helix repeat-containing protein [Candidatus Hydrogenedentota bacterium]
MMSARILLITSSVAWISALAPATVYVDISATGAHDGSSWNDAFTTLQEGVDAAAPGERIWVAGGIYNELRSASATGSLEMKEGVRLYGGFAGGENSLGERDWGANLTVIDGANGRGVGVAAVHVVVGANNATLDGFTVTGGHWDVGASLPLDRGAGMFNPSVNGLTVAHCTFSGNVSSWGAGMCNFGGSSPTISHCLFDNNTAVSGGGGMYNYSASHPTVTNCVFSNNDALDAYAGGGGMFNYGGSNPVVTGCTFEGNTTARHGGGMWNNESSPQVTGCEFRQNSAPEGGGMMNYISRPVVSGCTFGENTATVQGGAVYNYYNSHAVFSLCIFRSNESARGAGMADSYASPAISQCVFEGNTASEWGGGLSNNYLASPVVTDCEFTQNSASWRGGGVGNQAELTARFERCVFRENVSQEDGGGMSSWASATPEVADCQFVGNSADWYGGGMSLRGASAVVEETSFERNTAVVSGGGLHVMDDQGRRGSYTVRNSTFVGNSAGGNGGGVFGMDGSDVDLEGCVFSGNEATSGGALTVHSGASASVTRCEFTSNRGGTSGRGGGIYAAYAGLLEVSASLFTSNEAELYGGALYTTASESTVSECRFVRNSAGRGGALYSNFQNTGTVVSNGVFDGNWALLGGPAGGAVGVDHAPFAAVNCTFSRNTSAEGLGTSISGLDDAAVSVVNSVFWGESGTPVWGDLDSVTYSDIQGGYPGEGNMDEDPLFLDAASGNLALGIGSPCVDTASLAEAPPADIRGGVRPSGPGVDMGAYEAALRVYEPGANAARAVGDLWVIRWETNPAANGAFVRLALQKGGVIVCWITRKTENDGEYVWRIPRDLGPGTYRLRVQAFEDPVDHYVGPSVRFFEPPVRVTSPDGGETWSWRRVQAITWESDTAAVGGFVRLGLHEGRTFLGWIALHTENDGAFLWPVPPDLPADADYRIRVQSYDDPGLRDWSDAPFAIVGVEVALPNGGEYWTPGEVRRIQWRSGGEALVPDVRIALWRAGVLDRWLVRRTANDGAWNWIVPGDLILDTDYTIRVQSYADPRIRDDSDVAFAIGAPAITVASPNGAENLVAGTMVDIQWQSLPSLTGEYVRVGLKPGRNAEVRWLSLRTENDGLYSHPIPVSQPPLAWAKILVQSYADKQLRDFSDMPFVVGAP